MAYNAITGSLIAAQNYIPGDLIVGNIVSGSLRGDGSQIEYVPRVSNATDNSLLTNVSGDANTLTCESNLTFNGTTNNLYCNGTLTASMGLSASIIYGDGSGLTNVSSLIAAGPTYSLQVHDVANDLTGSSTLTFQDDVLTIGGGLTLKRRSITSTITASATDYYLGVDSTGGAIEIRMPPAATLDNGQTFVVKDEGGAAETNNITILASGSQTIDGSNQVVLLSPHAAVSLYCNGSDKYYLY